MRIGAVLALATAAASYNAGGMQNPSSRRAHSDRRATVSRLDESSREAAEAGLKRAQERMKSYNQDRQKEGKPMFPPITYNVLYTAIVVLTAKDVASNDVVKDWVSSGAPLNAAPIQALGGPGLLVAYALFQLLFSFGAGQSAPFRLAVTKLGVTEPPFSSPLNDETRDGAYFCSSCGAKLFDSAAKYDSGSGWPSFWRTAGGGVEYRREALGGRMEIKCSNCGSHLGHVFSDGPAVAPVDDPVPATDPGGPEAAFVLNDPTVRPRFCVNGAALKFEEAESGSGRPELNG